VDADRTHRICVVDDDEKSCKLLAAFLTREQTFTVQCHADGESAFEAIAAEPPDAVLLDVMLPGIDGIEVCRRIRADERLNHVPVLLITGLTEREVRLAGIEAGANDFLTKPLDRQEVLLRVRNAVRVKDDYDRLQRLESLRDGLVHMIVHDMRVPMTVVDGALQFLQKRATFPADAPEHRMLANARRSTRSMCDIITSLLDVSKLESGTLPLARTTVDLVAVIHEALQSVHRPARDAPVAVEAPATAVLVDCDPSIVGRVVANLRSLLTLPSVAVPNTLPPALNIGPLKSEGSFLF